MRRPMAAALSAALWLGEAAWAAPEAQRFDLENGLSVILRTVAGSQRVACVVLLDIGDAHDPPGRSGLCHLVEHLYVTAAARERPATTAESWMRRYGGQVNAQTGRDYTVIAAVFARERLEAEIAEAAARMGDLRIEQADLDRELPRLELELGNMYGGMPHLAALNLAGGAACPLPPGGRKGGIMEQVRAVTLEEARDWHTRHYKPVNATLALAGGFDAALARERIAASFGALARGAPPPGPRPPEEAAAGSAQRVTVPAPAFGGPKRLATLAFRAPDPGSDLYAPFLVLASRLLQQSMPEAQAAARRGSPLRPVWYAPFDMPEIIAVCAEMAAGQGDEEAVALLRGRVAAATALREGDPVSLLHVRQHYGLMLGLRPLPETADLYFQAFALGRRRQLGLEPEGLEAALSEVTADDLGRCAAEFFAPERGAAVIVRAE